MGKLSKDSELQERLQYATEQLVNIYLNVHALVCYNEAWDKIRGLD